MRVGISVLTHENQNIWQNGLGQNVVFLAQLLRALPFVQNVVLIDVGNQRRLPPGADAVAQGFPVLSQRDATDAVDVVIEMAGALDPQWLSLMRARGCKIVFHCCGQPFVALTEPAVFSKPVHSSRPDRCDEVWLLPKDEIFLPMMRTLHRCPAHIVPFIWHPAFVEQRIADVNSHGVKYGYELNRQPDEGLRVAIFEPNISVVKTSMVPMLVCDEAWRADRSAIDRMHVLNTLHVKDHPTMLYFANSLDLVRERRATFHGRHDVVGFMGQQADAVVAHQWQNDQNYLYLDILYGDYPLVHNSGWLKAGYYYPDSDAVAGGRQLAAAARDHGSQLDAYRARTREVFSQVDPFVRANRDAYAARLLSLAPGHAGGRNQ